MLLGVINGGIGFNFAGKHFTYDAKVLTNLVRQLSPNCPVRSRGGCHCSGVFRGHWLPNLLQKPAKVQT